MHYILQPEVPGALGDNTILDSTVHPPKVQKLHFIFHGWLGDDIIECFPCFLVSEKLKNLISKGDLTGYIIEPCEISFSEEFLLLHRQLKLPTFAWLKITGDINSDFFINAALNLQVSEKIWEILKGVNIKNCDVTALQ